MPDDFARALADLRQTRGHGSTLHNSGLSMKDKPHRLLAALRVLPLVALGPMLLALGAVTHFTDTTVSAGTPSGDSVAATNSAGGSAIATPTPYVTTPAAGACTGSVYSVTPSNYQAFFSTHGWAPGDLVQLVAGSYPGLSLYNINGTSSCPIIVTGPPSGAPAMILGTAGANTLRLQNSSYLTVQYLEVDAQDLGGDGVNGQTTTHDITLEHLYIHNCRDDAGDERDAQGVVGISTNRALVWNWTIRHVTITDCGTGMYLGNSDGNQQFLNGLIEYNLFYDTLGYNTEIKFHNPLPVPGPAGMPTGQSTTIIRYNTWSKANNSNSGGLERPNLLVGNAPVSGPAAEQESNYLVYGNFFYQNPEEALFQGAGNIAMYDNLFVNTLASGAPAISLQSHDTGVPRKVALFHNTVVMNGSVGISISGSDTGYTQAAIGNAVFSGGTPISGGMQADNLMGTYASASTALTNPFLVPGSGLDLFPKVGQLSGSAIDLSAVASFPDYLLDFNGVARGASDTIRGAYGAQGTNPGWLPQIAIQPTRSLERVAPSAPTHLRLVHP